MNPSLLRRAAIFSLVFFLGGPAPITHAQLAPPTAEIPLYPGVAPGSENWTWSERAAGSPTNPTEQNVVKPELMVYPADRAKAVGTAVIVAPGGGFQNLMMSYEGVDIARKLNDMGIDAFVLKYRLKYTDPAARARGRGTTQPSAAALPTGPQAWQDVRAMGGADGQQAVRLVREHAAEFGYAPDRIGMIGFSAGGAVLIRTIHGPAETRPNFGMMIYGAEATSEIPPAGAPPLFIAVAADDQSVGYQGAIDLFEAWHKANLPAELHVFQTGRHGFGTKGGGADHFMDRVQEWLKVNGYLTKPTAPK